MKFFLVLYCIVSIAESTGSRSPLKRSRGTGLPTLFEEELEIDPEAYGVHEMKRRSPPSDMLEGFDESKDPRSPLFVAHRPRMLRLPTGRPSLAPAVQEVVAAAPVSTLSPDGPEEGNFFFADLSDDSDEKYVQRLPTNSFSPMAAMGGIRRSMKSFDFSEWNSILASGDYE